MQRFVQWARTLGLSSPGDLWAIGDTSDAALRHDNQDGLTSTRWAEIETSSSQVLDYTLSISAGTATATLHVAGFSE